MRVLAHLRRSFGFAQTLRAFVQQGFERNAVDQIHRIEHIALRLTHLLALRIAHQAVDVHMLERHLAGEVRGHHDHARHPEEDDVVAGHQHAGGQVQIAIGCFVGPTHGAERHQRRGVPGVQHIGVTGQGFARRLGLRIGFVVRHIDLAVFVIPSGYLVAPPELAADAPIGDVVHPLVVGVDPVLRHKFHFARLHRVNRFLRDAFAGGVLRADLVHGDKPLVGQHGLDHLAGAGANRQHHFVRFDLQHQPQVL